MPSNEQIRENVRQHYAKAAKRVQRLERADCACDGGCTDTDLAYAPEDLRSLPQEAVLASLGCGNPLLLAKLQPGETVLDLGSGGGIDVLLSAKRVGPTGKAYGVDMTDEMLSLARANAAKAGATNVEFLKGTIEAVPLPAESVDVIISNCVINLAADKSTVLAEAYRLLRPGGRLAVADIVVTGGSLSDELRNVMALWAGCISGAITDEEYRDKLTTAGFADIELQELKEYSLEDVPEEARPQGQLNLDPNVRVISAFVRAVKPRETQGGQCCGA